MFCIGLSGVQRRNSTVQDLGPGIRAWDSGFRVWWALV